MSNATLCIYYRLMGASIGSGVKLQGAVLGEWDLLDIHSGATLEKKSVCRPFAGERNTSMYLAPIVVGRNASIGLASVVAPGTHVPPETCIGPNSSSWELDDATEANRDLLPSRAPDPHWVLSLLATLPITVVARLLGRLPWLLGIVGLVMHKPQRDPSINGVLNILHWFSGGPRSHIVTSDGVGAETVTIEDRAMVADRVVVLPGSTVGAGAVMGSGALARRGKYYGAQGRFVGSSGGDRVCLLGGVSNARPMDKVRTKSSEAASPVSVPVSSAHPSLWGTNEKEEGKASTPFGRAFYQGQAPYPVLGQLPIACYSSLTVVLVAAYWDTPSILAIQVTDRVLRQQGPLPASD
jgi:acetyltransferase-like isoleucine patch superfamily enzyme